MLFYLYTIQLIELHALWPVQMSFMPYTFGSVMDVEWNVELKFIIPVDSDLSHCASLSPDTPFITIIKIKSINIT